MLAAYEPIAELNLGIVAKIDVEEIRRPFIRASLVTAGVGLMFINAVFFSSWMRFRALAYSP